jgi:hypothetical protein
MILEVFRALDGSIEEIDIVLQRTRIARSAAAAPVTTLFGFRVRIGFKRRISWRKRVVRKTKKFSCSRISAAAGHSGSYGTVTLPGIFALCGESRAFS